MSSDQDTLTAEAAELAENTLKQFQEQCSGVSRPTQSTKVHDRLSGMNDYTLVKNALEFPAISADSAVHVRAPSNSKAL
jgi:hypothetical protein